MKRGGLPDCTSKVVAFEGERVEHHSRHRSGCTRISRLWNRDHQWNGGASSAVQGGTARTVISHPERSGGETGAPWIHQIRILMVGGVGKIGNQVVDQIVRHPPRSGWLDELGRLKGGWVRDLGVALKRAYGSGSELSTVTIRGVLLADVLANLL
jgi:hypothetical protein